MWSYVGGYFEDFGNEDELNGWLSCNPGKVAEILNIEISEGL